ncbi:MAG: hypothetical protein K8R08_00480 [Methanosarcinales archaeon]|nr:hypothetical protein [Methanosarcinales archaeon]
MGLAPICLAVYADPGLAFRDIRVLAYLPVRASTGYRGCQASRCVLQCPAFS